MFSPLPLSPSFFNSLYVHPPSSTRGKKFLKKDWATWGGEAEPWGFFWSVSKIRWKIVLEKRKNVERQLNDLEEETSKLADRHRGSRHLRRAHEWTTIQGSSLNPTRLGRRTNPKIPEETICCSLVRGGCTHAMFWNENSFTEMKCGNDGRARMEKRTRREAKKKKNYGRDKTEVWEVELFNLPKVLLMVVAVAVPQIQCIAVCDGKTSSVNL